MAARTRKTTLNESWRGKIRASMLILRLQDHAMGAIELSATQVRAIEILLRKVAPDMLAVEHTGEITHQYVAELPHVQPIDEWIQQNESLSGARSPGHRLDS